MEPKRILVCLSQSIFGINNILIFSRRTDKQSYSPKKASKNNYTYKVELFVMSCTVHHGTTKPTKSIKSVTALSKHLLIIVFFLQLLWRYLRFPIYEYIYFLYTWLKYQKRIFDEYINFQNKFFSLKFTNVYVYTRGVPAFAWVSWLWFCSFVSMCCNVVWIAMVKIWVNYARLNFKPIWESGFLLLNRW